jgi:hypothetical protein
LLKISARELNMMMTAVSRHATEDEGEFQSEE